jgi:hypothetical protein
MLEQLEISFGNLLASYVHYDYIKHNVLCCVMLSVAKRRLEANNTTEINDKNTEYKTRNIWHSG